MQRSSRIGSSASSVARSFDVDDESQLLQLLNFIRRGPFEQSQKATLRDVVLDFAVTKNIDVLTVVATALQAQKVSLVKGGIPIGIELSGQEKRTVQSANIATQTKANARTNMFGSTRPNPIFTSAVPKEHTSVLQTRFEDARTIPVVDATPAIEESIEKKEPGASAPPSTPKEQAQTQPERQGTPEPKKTASASAEVSAEPSTQTNDDPLQRIKEIKSLVNAKVGNPVNLVDANNEVGREYMQALLNAMRVANSENGKNTQEAMQRLERAYQLVEQSIESGETVVGEKKAGMAGEPLIPTQPETRPKPKITPHTPPSQGPKLDADTKEHEPTGNPPQPIQAIHTPELTPMQSLAQKAKLPPKQAAPPIPSPVVPKKEMRAAPLSLAEKVRRENIAREELVEKLFQTKTTADANVQTPQASGDPLYTLAVSSGLQQLLSEWSLFKSSGIFGMGPSGYEHPLYKTLSSLPMAAVIAGRYEGSRPEVKQSITAYMNGWRYEHNVIHQMNETFEHYLRRVIAEILSRQKKRHTA